MMRLGQLHLGGFVEGQLSAEELLSEFEAQWSQLIEERYAGQDRLMQALSYAASGQGKRVRPLLALLACQALGQDASVAMASALALELVHTYSLVHDDLPCMDDDALRRGRPTVHIAFDEPTALLVGDSLLTEAFSILSEAPEPRLSDRARLALISTLAKSCGPIGMVAGQAQDLYWTGRKGASRSDLDSIHRLKTGCLLEAAAEMGGIAAGATALQRERLSHLGATIGLAFQIRDDLIDGLEGTGKSKAKDLAKDKLTYLSFMSAQEAQNEVLRLSTSAIDGALKLGKNAAALARFIEDLIKRQY